MFVALILPGRVMAETEAFADMDLHLSQDDVSLLMGGDMSFHFSKAALEALANGLPLAVDTEIVLRPVDKWYWQKSIASYNYKMEIQYHALSQQYLVTEINASYPKAFLTQSSALIALGRINELPLIELSLLDPDAKYQVSVRSSLDSESLPVPLRPLTYLSDEWRLRTDWKRLDWPVKN